MLTHPSIVRIFDFIEDERSAAISMEYVDGATLSSLRVKKASKCFEVEEIAPWVASLCDALSYAHESAHLVHRDLKPSNLMVNSKEELKITDFGIACTLRDSMTYVSVRTSSGTLNYMSPQQLLGEDPAASDDIYAVGATLFEMLSSKPPFFGGDVASQVREVIPPTIAQRRAKFGIEGAPIPKYWEETLAGCLAKSAEARPRSAADLARRLRLNGPVRLASAGPKPNKLLSAVTAFAKKLDRRGAALAGAALPLILLAFMMFYPRKAEPVAPVKKPAKRGAALAYAIEKPAAPAVSAAEMAEPQPKIAAPETVAAEPATTDEEATPKTRSTKVPSKNATLQLTTTPSGASFSIYPGVIANKTAPDAAPLRSGSTPGTVEDLPPGRYTLFFHNPGWPDDRAEVSVNAGEAVPVDYSFPHGSANITSTPDGAEIFLGSQSLGNAPLTADLPLGKQKLTAKLPNMSERSQTVTIGSQAAATVTFDMNARTHSSKAKPKPTPSAFDKLGQSLKHVFGGKTTPAPKKKN